MDKSGIKIIIDIVDRELKQDKSKPEGTQNQKRRGKKEPNPNLLQNNDVPMEEIESFNVR